MFCKSGKVERAVSGLNPMYFTFKRVRCTKMSRGLTPSTFQDYTTLYIEKRPL